jgi:hypothetical protein
VNSIFSLPTAIEQRSKILTGTISLKQSSKIKVRLAYSS